MARLPKPKLPILEEYERKRKFERTPEPSAREGGEFTAPVFVVQKHAARRLHYDFRLAIDGTLKSWAVPKAPSMNSRDKRLAVRTEDHPLAYGGFEGKIPEGNYGAGTVMVWDRGTFVPEGNLTASQQLQKGEIKFSLNGEKLRGSFALVKLKNSEKGSEWLMIKHRDAAEDTEWNVDNHDGSVLTGRTLDEIKEGTPPKRAPSPLEASRLTGAEFGKIPARLEPMLATLGERPFSDPNWLFEIKWDGVRALAWITDGQLTLRSRNANDVTKRYPELATLPAALAAREAILDGEIVALDERGHSNFHLLQERMHVQTPGERLISKVPVVYFLFDLLYCDGYDLRRCPLIERKQLLRRLVHGSERIRFSDHQAEKGKELFELARQSGLEGILAKRADSIYVSDRSPSWIKLKVTSTIDAVVGGWTAARTPSLKFGALLLGLYEGKKLRFIGHVGTGFDGELQNEIGDKLEELASKSCPFDTPPVPNEKPSWVKPELIARVKYGAWTTDKVLRHPVFLALRDDIKPIDCPWREEKPEVAAGNGATSAPAGSPAVVRAPEVVGRVVREESEIGEELFKGKQETITVEMDGKRFRLTHLNKIYFPDSGYTKRELLAYYYRMAEYVLPFLRGRALVLRRYPDGITGQAFFQKDLHEGLGLPDWFKTVPIDSEGRGKQLFYATAEDRASLLYLTGLGCIDHNPWTSRYDDLDRPDYFFFDLDPSDGTEFSVGVTIAKALHERLQELRVKSFIKTSGATGIHIFVPVEPVYSYEQLRTFAEIVARTVSNEHPNLITNERIIAKRPPGRILIDVQQNAHGRPLACAYSVRAFPKAPVSTPILPQDLKPKLRPESLNIKTMPARLKEKGDLWADFWKSRQRLDEAIELLSAHMPSRGRKSVT